MSKSTCPSSPNVHRPESFRSKGATCLFKRDHSTWKGASTHEIARVGGVEKFLDLRRRRGGRREGVGARHAGRARKAGRRVEKVFHGASNSMATHRQILSGAVPAAPSHGFA